MRGERQRRRIHRHRGAQALLRGAVFLHRNQEQRRVHLDGRRALAGVERRQRHGDGLPRFDDGVVQTPLKRRCQFECRRPRHAAHDRQALVIGTHGIAVLARLGRLLRLTAELVGLLTLVVGERQGGFLRVVGDRGAQHHAGVLPVEPAVQNQAA